MFTSSAAALASEFHFDGFRVDLTQSIHSDNVLHADGRSVGSRQPVRRRSCCANGASTLRLIRPNVFLIAEDHTGWRGGLHSRPTQGGLGFDATWYADYYHHLIGDAQNDPSRARLIKLAGYGDNDRSNMTWFSEALAASAGDRVVYHESHDEAGNSSAKRTARMCTRHAPSSSPSTVRRWSATPGAMPRRERALPPGSRCYRPAIPMFFMGEEVGASLPYRFDDFLDNREDFPALRQGAGARLFRFYPDVLRLRLAHPAFRSRSCQIVHVHDTNRVIAFRCWTTAEDILVVGCLNDWAFPNGYRIQDTRIADGEWREIFSSDADIYGGSGLSNSGAIASSGGAISVNVPANSVFVLQRQ